jgi:hypothetical protein
MKFFWQRDDLAGVDDPLAEEALARRARQRQGAAASWWCRRRFRHPREAIQFTEPQFLFVDTCACVLPTDHDGDCLCEHGIEGRAEHDATCPLGGTR